MPLDRQRRAHLLRLFGDLALRWFEMTHVHWTATDYEGTCVFLSVLQASVRDVGRDPVLNPLYDREPPPDDLRRPVSLREAARSLGIPRERFRRRALLLAEAGAIDLRDDGYIVPARAIRPEVSRRQCRDVGIFHRRLQAAGFPIADIPFTSEPDAWRQGILRLMGDLQLAWARLAAEPFGGSVVVATVFAAIVQANDYPTDDGVRSQPRPITGSILATSLGLPRESVRRYIAQLEKAGWVSRTTDGVIVNAAILDSEAIAFVEPLLDLTTELFAILSAQGATFSNDYGSPETV